MRFQLISISMRWPVIAAGFWAFRCNNECFPPPFSICNLLIHIEYEICKWIHLRCAYEHIYAVMVAAEIVDAASVVVTQHLVTVSWYLSFRQLVVVARDEEKDVEYADAADDKHIRMKRRNKYELKSWKATNLKKIREKPN